MKAADAIAMAVASASSDAPRSSGVYIIVNTVTMRAYIGQSKNIALRWQAHKSSLKRGDHSNTKLQADWLAYGESVFRFHVVSSVSPAEALSLEKALTLEVLGVNCYNHSAAACPGRSAGGAEPLVQRSIRLPPDLWAKIDAHGLEWLRGLIRRARPPK